MFEHLGDRHLGPADLDAAAGALGRIHAAAHTQALHGASLDQPYAAPGLVITDFITPRAAALQHLPLPIAELPVAFYKDANIRNFLRTDDGIAVVDFDDLTLAPFGYDLAKLIISTAMTFGRLTIEQIDQARQDLQHRSRTSRHRCDLHRGCPAALLRVPRPPHRPLPAPQRLPAPVASSTPLA
ncbi:phosphotransferase [Amycolatopsis vastitatis]|uniref:phosphotransferase n=1 Tax=Amycolatopsis vastitatis TaxID=1905142 RepID=UPI0013040205